MGTFFRDYIYIPLGGSRKGKKRGIINILVVWAVTGLWHGAHWNFVMWGLYYAALLILEKMFLGDILKKIPKLISWMYTFFITVVGWTLFMWDTDSISYMLSRIARLFSQDGVVLPYSVSVLGINANMIYLIIGIIISTPLGKWFFDSLKKLILPYTGQRQVFLVMHDVVMIGLFIVCIIFIVGETFNPFIYFRF